MRTLIFIVSIISFLTSCNSPSENGNDILEKARKSFASGNKEYNQRILIQERLIDSIYQLSDTNKFLAIKYIDNLIASDSLFHNLPLNEAHFIKGDIYYSLDSFDKAIKEFTLSGGNDMENMPKYLAARAGAYIKNKQYDNAFDDLAKAAKINHQYYWNIGNYYEIIQQKDSAIANYERLYLIDEKVYSYCKDRLEELKRKKPKLLTELIYKDRIRAYILLGA